MVSSVCPFPPSFPFHLGSVSSDVVRMVISQSTAVILFPYSAHLDAMCLISRHPWTLFSPRLLRNRSSQTDSWLLPPPPSHTTGYTHTPSSEEPRMMTSYCHCQESAPEWGVTWLSGAGGPELSPPPSTCGGRWAGKETVRQKWQHAAPGGGVGQETWCCLVLVLALPVNNLLSDPRQVASYPLLQFLYLYFKDGHLL